MTSESVADFASEQAADIVGIRTNAAHASLLVDLDALNAHHSILETEMGKLAKKVGKVRIEGDLALPRVAAGLAGEGCEAAERVRGGEALLLPLRPVGAGLWAWLGYREEWDLNSTGRASARRKYIFRSAGLTVHFGVVGDRQKPQLFRAEWAGWADWPEGLGFQAGDAAHPHWQFDALDTLVPEGESNEAEEFLALLRAEQGEVEAREFTPHGLTASDIRSLVRQRPLSRIHFPSGAQWWKQKPDNAHAHTPRKSDELRRWVMSSVEYIWAELDRLSVA